MHIEDNLGELSAEEREHAVRIQINPIPCRTGLDWREDHDYSLVPKLRELRFFIVPVRTQLDPLPPQLTALELIFPSDSGDPDMDSYRALAKALERKDWLPSLERLHINLFTPDQEDGFNDIFQLEDEDDPYKPIGDDMEPKQVVELLKLLQRIARARPELAVTIV